MHNPKLQKKRTIEFLNNLLKSVKSDDVTVHEIWFENEIQETPIQNGWYKDMEEMGMQSVEIKYTTKRKPR